MTDETVDSSGIVAMVDSKGRVCACTAPSNKAAATMLILNMVFSDW